MNSKGFKIPCIMGEDAEAERVRFRSVAGKLVDKICGSAKVPGPHPLLQEYLLRRIFKYFITNITTGMSLEVRSCRQVCTVWHEIVTELYNKQRETPVSIGVQDPFEFQQNPLGLSPDLKTFVATMQNSLYLPVTRFTLGSNLFVAKNRFLLKKFFGIVGVAAVELNIYFDSKYNINFTNSSFPEDLQMSQLKKLTLELDGNKNKLRKRQVTSIFNFIEFLFTVAGEVKCFSLEMINLRKKEYSLMGLISKVIPILPEKVEFLSLKCPLGDADLEVLTESKHEITKLELETTRLLNPDQFHSFLFKQSPHLKELRLYKQPGAPKLAHLKFPLLPNLTFIKFAGNENSPFNSFEKLPALITMDLSNAQHIGFAQHMVTRTIPLKKNEKPGPLKEIIFPLSIDASSLAPLAARHLNNMSILHLGPCKEFALTLTSVFQSLVTLQELYVTFPLEIFDKLNGDELLCGIEEPECEVITLTRSFYDISWADVQSNPSLSNLINLRKLVMKDDYCHAFYTNITAVLLMRMPMLRNVNMSRSRITGSFITQLKDSLESLELADDGYKDLEYDSDVEWTDDIIIHGIPDLGQEDLPGMGRGVFLNN